MNTVVTRQYEMLVRVQDFGNTRSFEVPRTNHALLAAARQFVRDAMPFEAAFVAHGMAPGVATATNRPCEA